MFNLNLICLFGNLIAIFMYFGVSLFIYFTLPNTKQSKNLIIFNLCVGIWCLCPLLINLDFISYPYKIIIQKICYIFAVLLIPAFFNFVSSIIDADIFQKRRLPLYVISSIFISLLTTNYFIKDVVVVSNLYQSDPGLVYYFFIGYLVIIFATLVYILHYQYNDNKYKKILLNGFIVQLLGGGFYFATILKIIPVYSFAGYIIAFGEFLLFYAIIKYELILANEKNQNDFQQYLTETTKELIELKDMQLLSSSMGNLLKRNTDCLDCKIYILDKAKYINYAKEDESVDETHPLVDILSSQHDIISNREVKRWAYEIKTPNFIEITAFFEKHHLIYIIPLFFGDLIGFICVGPKKEGKEYTELDKKIFDLIGYSGSIAVQNIFLETTSIKDDLTQLYNKKYFNSKFREYINVSMQNENSFTLAFIDFDNFSTLNLDLGHLACDGKLKEFSKLAKKHFRIDDFIARWGGEEFVVLLPNTTLKDGSRILENFLRIIEKELNITFSSGMAFFDGKDKEHKQKNIEQLVTAITNESDKNMYQAKNNGKNQVYPNCETLR